jgi:hypothetical protein
LEHFLAESMEALVTGLAQAPQLRLRVLELEADDQQVFDQTLLAFARVAPGLEALKAYNRHSTGRMIAAVIARMPKLALLATTTRQARDIAALAIAQWEHPALRMIYLNVVIARTIEIPLKFTCPVRFIQSREDVDDFY